MQLIGGQWRQMQKDQRNEEKEAQKRGPRVGDKELAPKGKVQTKHVLPRQELNVAKNKGVDAD